MNGSIVLFEDQHQRRMWPITLTRPAFGVTCAAWNLREVASLASPRVSHLVRDYLQEIADGSFPQGELQEGPVLFLNAAVAPDVRYATAFREWLDKGEPFLSTSGERVSVALLPSEEPVPEELSAQEATGYLLGLDLPLNEQEPLRTFDYPFQVIGSLEELFPANLERRIQEGEFSEPRPGVFVAEGVELAETAVLRPDEGQIVLDEGVEVMDFCYLQGPLYVGPGSRVIERSSIKEFTSIRHTCKIGGEVEATIVEPYSNKQHHGFLGHSYVGSWVNLGAGTSNSDLKNTYGEVRVQAGDRRVETGLQFLGCVLGDYSKSAINTSIFTGKTVGVASMLYGLVGQNVPSFCNYARSFGQVTGCSVEQAIKTQKRMFARREVEQTEEDVALLEKVFELTRQERRIAEEPPSL